jgi:hypothetical protein
LMMRVEKSYKTNAKECSAWDGVKRAYLETTHRLSELRIGEDYVRIRFPVIILSGKSLGVLKKDRTQRNVGGARGTQTYLDRDHEHSKGLSILLNPIT